LSIIFQGETVKTDMRTVIKQPDPGLIGIDGAVIIDNSKTLDQNLCRANLKVSG